MKGGDLQMSPNENGMGRPFAGEDRRSTTIRLRMEPAEVERLDRLADKLNTTRSGAIREGLRRLEDQIDGEQE
jgi:hypothetical protein